MITSKSYLNLFYVTRIFFFFNYTRPFIFWVMTELNLLLFIILVVMMDISKFKQETHDLVIFYFIIQSLASILILRDFFFSREFHIFNSDSIFICSLLIKLGAFPFFLWVFKVSQFFGFKSIIILLTIQKIPFFLFLFNSTNIFISLILVFSFLRGALLIVYSNNLIFMIVASSLSSRYWLFYLHRYRILFFFLYFTLYGLFVSLLLYSYHRSSSNTPSSIFTMVLFAFILGLSPLSLFFFKLYTMFFLFFNYKILEVCIFWLVRFICLFGYIKFSYKSFFSNSGVYEVSSSYIIKSLFFFFSLITFFIFLLY